MKRAVIENGIWYKKMDVRCAWCNSLNEDARAERIFLKGSGRMWKVKCSDCRRVFYVSYQVEGVEP